MLTKENILRTINELPDKFSIEDLFERIILLQKIDIARAQSKAGETFTTEEAKEKLSISGYNKMDEISFGRS